MKTAGRCFHSFWVSQLSVPSWKCFFFFFFWWAEQGSFLQDSLNSWCYSQLIKQLTVKWAVQIHIEQPLCNLQKKQSTNKNQNFSASWSASLCVADSSTGRVTLLAFPTEPLGSDLPSARRVEATDPPTATCRWMPRAFSWKVALNPLQAERQLPRVSSLVQALAMVPWYETKLLLPSLF